MCSYLGQSFRVRVLFIHSFYLICSYFLYCNDKSNEEVFVSTSREDCLTADVTGCRPSQKYAIIVHGWRESCNTSWAQELRESEFLSSISLSQSHFKFVLIK